MTRTAPPLSKIPLASAIISGEAHNDHDPEYDAFLAAIQDRFTRSDALGKQPLFFTDVSDVSVKSGKRTVRGLFPLYLANLPQASRQYYNCHACKRFFEKFGSVVRISPTGEVSSPIWHEDDAPEMHKAGIRAVRLAVEKAPIGGVFFSEEETWGHRMAGGWDHIALTPSSNLVYKPTTLTAEQDMAVKREEFHMLVRAMGEFPRNIALAVVNILEANALTRAEKFLGPAKWFAEHMENLSRGIGNAPTLALTWRAVATAPTGFCHVKSSVLGSLYEDLCAKVNFETASKRFNEKVHTKNYQRPTEAPSEGNLAQAEKVIAKLGSEGSLDRKFATIEEVVAAAFWSEGAWFSTQVLDANKRKEDPKSAVFGHIKPKQMLRPDSKPVWPFDLPPRKITWEKFNSTVLQAGHVAKLELYVDTSTRGFVGITAPVHPDAPPILKWDNPSCRNPYSEFTILNANANSWELLPGRFVEVTAVVGRVFSWGDPETFAHLGKGVNLLLRGSKAPHVSLCLFPEYLKAEYFPIRASIEAYSTSKRLVGRDHASACGVSLIPPAATSNTVWNYRVRATSHDGKTAEYIIDRWE